MYLVYDLEMMSGKIASLHIHPAEPGTPLSSVNSFEVVVNKGIKSNGRMFNRTSKRTGEPTKRQVSLIEREQLTEHALALGHHGFSPGDARSNIETKGICLIDLVDQRVKVGKSILFFYELRTPCQKMDDLALGLRKRMENGCQGVMAQVLKSGKISLGDEITPLP